MSYNGSIYRTEMEKCCKSDLPSPPAEQLEAMRKTK
jgi:hypothetical protein